MITLITVATMLLALNQSLTVDHAVALKCTVIVSFAASFAATIADGMLKDTTVCHLTSYLFDSIPGEMCACTKRLIWETEHPLATFDTSA